MERWLISQIGDLRFEDLKIPFAIVTADLENDHLVTLTQGRLAPAIHASSTVPGFVAPIRIDGHLLADGSLLECVPVSTTRNMGADYVIGVDILIPKLHPEWGAFGYGFTALEMLVRHAGKGVDEADCTISPNLAGKTYFRFSKGRELIALGAKAAEAKVACIKEALDLK
jgi:NTE family protein